MLDRVTAASEVKEREPEPQVDPHTLTATSRYQDLCKFAKKNNVTSFGKKKKDLVADLQERGLV